MFLSDTYMLFSYFIGEVHVVVSSSLWPHGLYPARLLCPWDSPCKNTAVGCIALLQGIFLNRGSEPMFPVSPALQADLYRWATQRWSVKSLLKPLCGLSIWLTYVDRPWTKERVLFPNRHSFSDWGWYSLKILPSCV